MSIGERISELRRQAGMSQLELSRLMDVSRQAVSKWETDQTCPDTLNLIRLSEILDTDVEYLATGRKTLGRRPPVVITTTNTVEKVVEKPVIQIVERIVEKPIYDSPAVQFVEKPVLKKVYRTRYVRNPIESIIIGFLCFLAGILVGRFF